MQPWCGHVGPLHSAHDGLSASLEWGGVSARPVVLEAHRVLGPRHIPGLWPFARTSSKDGTRLLLMWVSRFLDASTLTPTLL